MATTHIFIIFTMTPGPIIIFKCKECGALYATDSQGSRNTFGGEFWTDGYASFPMLEIESRLLKDPHTNKICWIEDCTLVAEIHWYYDFKYRSRFELSQSKFINLLFGRPLRIIRKAFGTGTDSSSVIVRLATANEIAEKIGAIKPARITPEDIFSYLESHRLSRAKIFYLRTTLWHLLNDPLRTNIDYRQNNTELSIFNSNLAELAEMLGRSSLAIKPTSKLLSLLSRRHPTESTITLSYQGKLLTVYHLTPELDSQRELLRLTEEILLLRAEIYRELGDFKKSMAILDGQFTEKHEEASALIALIEHDNRLVAHTNGTQPRSRIHDSELTPTEISMANALSLVLNEYATTIRRKIGTNQQFVCYLGFGSTIDDVVSFARHYASEGDSIAQFRLAGLLLLDEYDIETIIESYAWATVAELGHDHFKNSLGNISLSIIEEYPDEVRSKAFALSKNYIQRYFIQKLPDERIIHWDNCR